MKRLVYLVIAAFLFTNCGHRIVRTGYDIDKAQYRECEVAIKKNIVISELQATKVGQIKLGESGFSFVCNEADAIEIMKHEACALNANLIVVIDENRSDLWSSCYRCTAEFYKYQQNSTTRLVSDEAYDQKNVKKRVKNDRLRNNAIRVGAFGLGLLTGYLIFM